MWVPRWASFERSHSRDGVILTTEHDFPSNSIVSTISLDLHFGHVVIGASKSIMNFFLRDRQRC